MHEKMIEYWNDVVRPADTVYHLGDLSFGSFTRTLGVLTQLNGHIHLVPGNHDSSKMKRQLEEINLVTIEPPLKVVYPTNTLRIVLCHFPLAVWEGQQRGWLHLHGHSHGRYQGKGLIMDVGTDTHPEHRPYSLEEIELAMAKKDTVSIDGRKVGSP
jgi:calcineurin-like phosphoesterase family protein